MKTFILIAILGAWAAQSVHGSAAGIDAARTAFLRMEVKERGSR